MRRHADRHKQSVSKNTRFRLPNGFRIWTDTSGKFTIPGQLAAFQDQTVWIRRADGLLAKVPLTQLSQADQQYLGRITTPRGD